MEERWSRLPKREEAPSIQDLKESVRRLREGDRVGFLLRSGRAVHDRTRLNMLALMNLAGELTTTELQAVMRLSQPNVTRHLSILKRAGIVVMTKHRKTPEVGEAGPGSRDQPHDADTDRTHGAKAGRSQGRREDGRRTYYSAGPWIARLLP